MLSHQFGKPIILRLCCGIVSLSFDMQPSIRPFDTKIVAHISFKMQGRKFPGLSRCAAPRDYLPVVAVVTEQLDNAFHVRPAFMPAFPLPPLHKGYVWQASAAESSSTTCGSLFVTSSARKRTTRYPFF